MLMLKIEKVLKFELAGLGGYSKERSLQFGDKFNSLLNQSSNVSIEWLDQLYQTVPYRPHIRYTYSHDKMQNGHQLDIACEPFTLTFIIISTKKINMIQLSYAIN